MNKPGCMLFIPHLTVNTDQGRFSFSQNFRSNQLKCKWNVRFKWKFSGTYGRPLEVLHVFCSKRLGWQLPFHLQKFPFLLLANLLALAPTSNLLATFQVFRPHGKSLFFSGPQRGLELQGSSLKICRAPGLQDRNIAAPGLHNISFEAPGFTVIKYSGLQASKSSGRRAPQQKFRASMAPRTALLGPCILIRKLSRISKQKLSAKWKAPQGNRRLPATESGVKNQPDGPAGSYADFTYTYLIWQENDAVGPMSI